MNPVHELREFFQSGATKTYHYRMKQLRALELGIDAMQMELAAALKYDLNKSTFEAYFSEISLIQAEIAHVKNHLHAWMKPKRVRPSLAQRPGRGIVYRQPFGVVLIVSPWNYPLQLSLVPLIGALAAGNVCLLKPSGNAPASAAVLQKLVKRYLDPRAYRVATGGRDAHGTLLDERYDLIFFTGSSATGKLVMTKAAKHLTPVILELGGKSPAIIDDTADLSQAIRRIVFGKLINSGQTCVAPDYLLVPGSMKQAVVNEIAFQYEAMIPGKKYAREVLPQIVNRKQYERLVRLLDQTTILYKGRRLAAERRFELCVIEADDTSPIMQEEIFGPILPIVTYQDRNEVIPYLQAREHPLALYLFSRDRAFTSQVIEQVEFGGGCINDTLMQLAGSNLPFGGVGHSGMGSYHGYHSYESFSHQKSILDKSHWFDLSMRYHPFRNPKRRLAHQVFQR